MKRVMAPDGPCARSLGGAARALGSGSASCSGASGSGSSNEEVSLADAIVTFPVSPDFPSLNLAQAVLLVGYEWRRAAGLARLPFPGEMLSPPATRGGAAVAVREPGDRAGTRGFFPPEKREIIARNMRDMLHRMAMTEQDVRTFRGVVRAVAGGRGPGWSATVLNEC